VVTARFEPTEPVARQTPLRGSLRPRAPPRS
jgi:hypothetical protein